VGDILGGFSRNIGSIHAVLVGGGVGRVEAGLERDG
jgi:hypothetical protein